MVKTETLYAIQETIQQAKIFVDTALYMRNVTLKYLKDDALRSLVNAVCGEETRYEEILTQLNEANSLLCNELYYRADEEEYSLQGINDDEIPF